MGEDFQRQAWQLVWSFVVAALFAWWVATPVPAWTSLTMWLWLGATCAAIVGASAVLTTRSLLRATYSVGVGLVAAAIGLVVYTHDASAGGPSAGDVVARIADDRAPFGGALGGAVVGGLLARALTSRRDDDG